MIKIKYPDYYKKFHCIAGECEKTCCAAWQVVIDDESKQCYENEKSPIGDKLRACMYFDGEDNVFRLKEGRCPFLDNDNLCEIYSYLGEQALCRTCERYPRFETDFGGRKELGLSVSCPTAAKLILFDGDFPEYLTEDEDILPTPNTTDPETYFAVMAARKHISEIVKSSENLETAFDECLEFAGDFQKLIGKDNLFEKTEKLISKKAKPEKHEYSSDCLEILQSLEKLDLETNELVLSHYGSKFELNSNKNELKRLFEYYLYRYFSSAVFDNNVIFPIKLSVFSVCCAASLLSENATEDEIIKCCVAYSREVEHSQLNLDKLKAVL